MEAAVGPTYCRERGRNKGEDLVGRNVQTAEPDHFLQLDRVAIPKQQIRRIDRIIL
ncbi:MAG: hypothetical protein ACRED8_12010 [Caulobacteraceae bacterium]